jgi:hypothetical protein
LGTHFAAVVFGALLTWMLVSAPVLAANACSSSAQDESWVDQGVDWMADVCATWVLEPTDQATNWFDKLWDRFGSDSGPPLDDDQIELEVVDVSEWEFLDDATRKQFFDAGLAPNMPRRSEEEAEALYEAIPGTTRALGEARLLEFLNSHTLTYLTPPPDILREVDNPDNLIWELRTVHEARGDRPMTAEELAAATIALIRTGQVAASTSSQTWYLLNRDTEFIEAFKYLGLANGTRTQAQAFELYNTIPEAFRNEGFWAVLYFFAVHDLSYRLPAADDPQLASTLGNVVWEDRLLKEDRQGGPLTDADLVVAEHALWAKSLTAGTPSSQTWYKLFQDPEALTWLLTAGEQALSEFNGSLAELRLVYESLPEWVRVAGPDAVRTFLASHNPTYAPGTMHQASPTWLLSRATSLDNLLWESLEVAGIRGPRAMTLAEIASAEEVLRVRFEAAEGAIALGHVPEIAAPQPVLEDIPIPIRRRLARLGLTAVQPDRMPSEVLALYKSIPSPIRVQGIVPIEDFLDRFTISHPVPAAFEPGHPVPFETYLWEKHATVRARDGAPVAAEEFVAAKSQMLKVSLDAMPQATWVVLKDHPEFRLQFDQLAEELSAPVVINDAALYLSIPRAVLLLGPGAVLDFLSEFGLSLKRPLSEFLAQTNMPTDLVWEPGLVGTGIAHRDDAAGDSLATDGANTTTMGGSSVPHPDFAVHGDSWDTLDPSLQQRLAFVGVDPNIRHRTLKETVALYMSIPEGVRVQGNVAVQDFLDTHTVSRKVPLTDFLSVATSARNSVWESSDRALARGFEPPTAADITAARVALVETYVEDLEVLKADPVLAGLVAGLYVGGRQVLPKLQTPPPPIRAGGTWNTLSPLLRQRFFGRGIPVGLPRRTALEAQALYLTIPPSIRVQGNAAVRDFLDTFQLSYRQPVTKFPALARVPGNAVWEPVETVVDRIGPMTADEVRRARAAVRQAARFAATRSGMTWYALMDEPGFLNNLKQRGLRNAYRTQSEAQKLYKTIPRGVRIQGPDAVKTFLDEVHLSHIVPVSENPALQKHLDNVVWEDPELNVRRGPRRMTDDEVRAARRELRRIGRQAGSRSNQTWYAIAQNPDRLGKFLDLDSPNQRHNRYKAKSLYENIPREIRDLGWKQVDEFVTLFDLSDTAGRAVTADDADLVWEKRSDKVKRGSAPLTTKDIERARKAVDGTLKDMVAVRKTLRAAARKAALKTATRNALVGGLAGVVLELPVSGGITFMEWHHGRMSTDEAIRQVALDAAIAAGSSFVLVGGGSLLTTLAPGVLTLSTVAAPVVIPVILVAGTAGGVAFLAAQVHQFCVSAQPEPAAP